MPRSGRDSDDDAEWKTGRTRSQRSNIHSAVNSPLRRSSRIKQSKCSPVSSESDTSSVSNSQPVKNTRSRVTTMDNIVSETLKSNRTRKPSISSDISESTDIDIIGTPKKRTTRSSLIAGSSGTPTKITRATTKRFIRAGSETKSPLPVVRTTRKTRASSVDPESLSEQSKSQPGTPIKTHKRLYVVPDSPVKEEDEKRNLVPYVRLDATIVETDEFINLENSDSSPEIALYSQQSQKIDEKSQSIHKSKVEEDTHELEGSLELSEEKDEIHDKHTDKITKDNDTILVIEEHKSGENSSSNTTDEVSMQNDSNLSSSKEEDKLEIIKSPLKIEKSLKHSTTKELIVKIENFLNTPIEQKGSPSNKENQTLNIINDKLESNVQTITNVTSPNTKCLSPIFVNKSLNEKETKFSKNLTDKQRPDSPSVSDTIKRQSLIHEADNKSPTNDTNESILSHEDVELLDKAIVKDKTPVKQISKSIENTMEDITKSDKVNEVEYTIMDTDVSKDSNKIELNKIPNSPKIQSKIEQESDNKKNLNSVSIIDNNEIKLVLEEQYQDEDQNQSSPSDILHSNSDQSVDLVATSSVNKNSNDQFNITKKQSITTQENIDNTDFTEQEQRNSSKYAIEPAPLESPNAALETINSTSNQSNEANAVIQDTQSSVVTELSEKLTNMSSKKAKTKSMLENIVKQDLAHKNTDNIHDHLEKEKDLQLENQKDTNTDSDVSMFHAIPNDNFNEKGIEEIDVETSSVHSNSQLLKELENESEAECDLVLVDKKAWLAAENIKAAKEAESFEYDSDDTVLLKSQLDAKTTNYEELPTINEDLSSKNRVDEKVRNRNKKSLTMIEEKKKDSKEPILNSFKKSKKHVLEECKDPSSTFTTDLIADVNKSKNEFRAIMNESDGQSVSKLNKSEQNVKAMERSLETDELDESDEIEDDANRLSRSLQVTKKYKSLSKSMERRKSLNKSLTTKDIPSKSEDTFMQNISKNAAYFEEKKQVFKQKLQNLRELKRSFLNKIQNANEDTSKSEEKNLSNIETPTYLNDAESDKDEVVISVMNFSKNSIIASKGSNSDEKSDSSDEDDSDTPAVPFETHSNDADSNTDVNSLINSDVEREYNLSGGEQEFSDNNVPADECLASESEASDPDDDGSDLASFIVNDDEVEEEEEENDDDDDDDNISHDDEEKEKSNSEEENMNIEEVEDAEKEKVDVEIDEQSVKEKNKAKKKKRNKSNEQDMENVENKAEENIILDEEGDSEENSIKDISSNTKMSSCSSEIKSTKIKRDIKKKKSDMMENKTILLDISHSDSSIKNKSYMQKNENTILLDTPDLSAKKKKRSSVRFSPQDVTEQNLMEQSNKSEVRKKLPKSYKLMECSTPKLDTYTQRFKFDETPETIKKISEKDTKTDDIKTTQDTSLKKKKSKKDLKILKENVSLTEFNPTSIEKKRLNRSLPSDLVEAIEKVGLSKPTCSKMSKLCKTINITHTESPTIRHLRKEKLNESAPVLNLELDSGKKKLSPVKKVKDIAQTKAKFGNDEEENAPTLNIELDSRKKKSPVKKVKDIAQTKTKLGNDEEENAPTLNIELDSGKKKSPVKKVKDIAQTKIKLGNDEEEIPNLITPSSDDVIQKRRKKQKKRKAQTKDISSENIIDEALFQDVMESDVPRKKKHIKFAQQIVEDDTCRDNQTDTKETKRKKKKQFSVIEQDENVNEENILEKNISKNKAESTRRKRKNYEIVNSSELDLSADMTVQKKSKRQKIAESEEIIPKKLLKKKKEKREEKISPLQVGTSNLKFNKNLTTNKLQKQDIPSDRIKSKNLFTKAREEALEMIHATEMRIRAKKELKKKKQENMENMIRMQVLKIPDKKQGKKVVEKNDSLPSSAGKLKRLPDDVVENLTDRPTKARKKQKLSQIRQQIPSVLSNKKSKVTTAMDCGPREILTLSSSGSTTQFTVVDLQKSKKQSKSNSTAASFRQRMLARNNREPVSAYMMYLEKQKATSSNRFFNNAF